MQYKIDRAFLYKVLSSLRSIYAHIWLISASLKYFFYRLKENDGHPRKEDKQPSPTEEKKLTKQSESGTTTDWNVRNIDSVNRFWLLLFLAKLVEKPLRRRDGYLLP